MQPQRSMAVLAAAVLSAVVATLLYAILSLAGIEEPWNIIVISGILAETKFVFIATLVHALVLGLPLFFFLRSKNRAGIIACALGGFAVAATPFSVSILIIDRGVPGPTGALVEWIEFASAAALVGLCGAAGGLAFWVGRRISGQSDKPPNDIDARPSTLRAWTFVILTGLLVCALFFVPSLVRDESCHNLFRDGRTSIGPKVGAEIKLRTEDWPALVQIFSDFGVKHSLLFRHIEHTQRGNVIWRTLSLCNEAGITIKVDDALWLAQTYSPLADRGTMIEVFELKTGSEWNSLARELLETIDATWPHKSTFRGAKGRIMSMEEALSGG